MAKLFIVLAIAQFVVGCTPSPKPKDVITLDAPKKGYWFLSEKFAYQFMRVELYDNHTEGLPSLTMEFRVKVESADSTWNANGDTVTISYVKPVKGSVKLKPVADVGAYKGRYLRDTVKLPLIEVRLGSMRKVMYYTESEQEMDRLLREKNKLRLDVVWGPTGVEVMQSMFRFTRPTKNDVLFDLGCGDARILIEAAKRFGTRGVGYDLDDKLIARGNGEARRLHVNELISLRTENFFSADLSSASIIAIYLSDRINSKLKPKFFRELKPGTRIVSHNWHMGDWQYDGREFMQDKSRVVYFWVMPANFSGLWEAEDGTQIKIRQHYQMAEFEIQKSGKLAPVESLRIRGTHVQHPEWGTLEIQGDILVAEKVGGRPLTLHRRAGSIEGLGI